MNYILRNYPIKIGQEYYFIFLYSDHLIIHRRNEERKFDNYTITPTLTYYQFKISDKIDWNNGCVAGQSRFLPFQIKNFCDRVFNNKCFW